MMITRLLLVGAFAFAVGTVGVVWASPAPVEIPSGSYLERGPRIFSKIAEAVENDGEYVMRLAYFETKPSANVPGANNLSLYFLNDGPAKKYARVDFEDSDYVAGLALTAREGGYFKVRIKQRQAVSIEPQQ